jgi:polysaccharide export outer membrane protein
MQMQVEWPMRSQNAFVWVLRLSVALALLAVLPGAASAQYRLQRGDVLEILVAGLPELKQKAVVGLDGEISTPMMESVTVAGLTLADAQKIVKSRMSQRLIHLRTFDGRESASAITPDSVSVMIAEYRPVYVDGDVSKPGEQIFRPGMTVRQAVSLAGGYEMMRFRSTNPFMEGADLRSEYQALWLEFVRKQAQIWRLRNELEGLSPSSLEDMTKAPLPDAEVQRVRALARDELSTRQERHKAEVAFLELAVRTAGSQVDLLKSRRQIDEESVKADTDDYGKLKAFSQRGSLSNARLSESRRLHLLSSAQSLQTLAQLAEAQRLQNQAQRELVRFEEVRRLELMRELDEAQLALGTIRARLQSVSEKIAYTGIIRSQLVRGGASRPSIRIARVGQGAFQQLSATEDTELQPGDTVEVALKVEAPERAAQD